MLCSLGQQMRDFLSTQILAQIVFKVIKLRFSQVAVLNASTGETTCIKRVAELMIEEFGRLFHKHADLKTSVSSDTNINHFLVKSKFSIMGHPEILKFKEERAVVIEALRNDKELNNLSVK